MKCNRKNNTLKSPEDTPLTDAEVKLKHRILQMHIFKFSKHTFVYVTAPSRLTLHSTQTI